MTGCSAVLAMAEWEEYFDTTYWGAPLWSLVPCPSPPRARARALIWGLGCGGLPKSDLGLLVSLSVSLGLCSLCSLCFVLSLYFYF